VRQQEATPKQRPNAQARSEQRRGLARLGKRVARGAQQEAGEANTVAAAAAAAAAAAGEAHAWPGSSTEDGAGVGRSRSRGWWVAVVGRVRPGWI